jgi:hypothetical protein
MDETLFLNDIYECSCWIHKNRITLCKIIYIWKTFICNHPITSTLLLIIEYFMESLSCVLIGTKGVFILHVVKSRVNNAHAQVHVMCRASHLSSPIIDVKNK